MTANSHIPVSQYLRMSTEHQQYSIERRTGLQQLLKDVVGGTSGYHAILVYDVSRWGRFQDTNESAHYEFLCKSAGVPVHYCAEIFANDGSLSSLIMKALKRTMAGEYSRDLGVRVFAGMKRLTLLGFKIGGVPGYGPRRMLVSSSGIHKQELAFGERKSIATDRVILVPGPAHEVATKRFIGCIYPTDELFAPLRVGSTAAAYHVRVMRNGIFRHSEQYSLIRSTLAAPCSVEYPRNSTLRR
jgi:DNA invertase Pin-like site-specific DNA recombinase